MEEIKTHNTRWGEESTRINSNFVYLNTKRTTIEDDSDDDMTDVYFEIV